jgi:tetratricopeptide (TPR) repeat protein
MNKKGVYLDENCLRMASNMRIQMAQLASALIEKGKKEKAIKVLDKALEEMPEFNVPFDATMYSICVAYYQAGAKEKGNKLASHLFDLFEKDQQFYNKMKIEQKNFYSREMRQTSDILNRLISLTAAYGDKDLADKFLIRIKNLLPTEEIDALQPNSPVMP